MIAYAARRVVSALVTLFGITLLVFILTRAVPGDPVSYHLGIGTSTRTVPPELVESTRVRWGLDRPLPVQYFKWVRALSTGDLGRSYSDARPVTEKISERVAASLELNGIALVLAIGAAIPLGVLSARRKGGRLDRSISVAAFILFAIPGFWLAVLLIELLVMRFPLLPLQGMRELGSDGGLIDHFRHLVLPVTVLASGAFALFLRHTRRAMIECLGEQHIIAARARGLSEARLVWKHAFRAALVPILTLIALVLPWILSGSVIVEQIFQWRGLGKLFFDAVLQRDYPLITGLTLLMASVTLLVNLVADLSYRAIDPRVSIEENRLR